MTDENASNVEPAANAGRFRMISSKTEDPVGSEEAEWSVGQLL